MKKETTMGAVKEQFIIDEQGERVAVILPLDEYEQLQEDLHDLAVVAERRTESTITLEELKKRL
ncbi:PHD/YefM family antitoxin component YafN of YafNO toxin-antitoxin module [Methanocalculus alkaliphilus]|uniref:type II toxin-antitoxin system Phd/YefM family antitoxin n=1 Tax=Methanocalculus alkaliphilus TaxID=768730 RepID=UPI00209F0D46|nr:type II toxin-antitoxin system Phd/YefM family antitoxin [Methanocalculus alkaliphilus]MCP1716297.1 PHD/YefM family antitoxin component YafN of YafNO toxin-antitoxin module [Methanocalculus alkaliphilus]